MSTQDHERFATTLLERATSDLAALKLLAAAESTREIAGFAIYKDVNTRQIL